MCVCVFGISCAAVVRSSPLYKVCVSSFYYYTLCDAHLTGGLCRSSIVAVVLSLELETILRGGGMEAVVAMKHTASQQGRERWYEMIKEKLGARESERERGEERKERGRLRDVDDAAL